jgi:hypothetical protein
MIDDDKGNAPGQDRRRLHAGRPRYDGDKITLTDETAASRT